MSLPLLVLLLLVSSRQCRYMGSISSSKSSRSKASSSSSRLRRRPGQGLALLLPVRPLLLLLGRLPPGH